MAARQKSLYFACPSWVVTTTKGQCATFCTVNTAHMQEATAKSLCGSFCTADTAQWATTYV